MTKNRARVRQKNNNMKIKLKITEKHFEKGMPGCPESCVVALALSDSLKRPVSRVSVMKDCAYITRNINQYKSEYYKTDLSQKLQKLIYKFDNYSLTKRNRRSYKNNIFTLNFCKLK